MQTPIPRKTLTVVVLSAALLTPPVHAADGSTPGFFGWLDAWMHHVTGWLAADEAPENDAERLTAAAETDEPAPAPEIEPLAMDDGSGGASTQGGDEGPRMDPTG